MTAAPEPRRIVVLALVALVGMLGAACGDSTQAPRWRGYGVSEPRAGGTLTTSTFLEVPDPAIANDDASMFPVSHLYDTLVALPAGPRGPEPVVPELAASYEISRDGRRYAFTLRDGVTFSNGRALVAADFAYALRRVLRSPDSPFRSLLKQVVDLVARNRDRWPRPSSRRLTIGARGCHSLHTRPSAGGSTAGLGHTG